MMHILSGLHILPNTAAKGTRLLSATRQGAPDPSRYEVMDEPNSQADLDYLRRPL